MDAVGNLNAKFYIVSRIPQHRQTPFATYLVLLELLVFPNFAYDCPKDAIIGGRSCNAHRATAVCATYSCITRLTLGEHGPPAALRTRLDQPPYKISASIANWQVLEIQ